MTFHTYEDTLRHAYDMGTITTTRGVLASGKPIYTRSVFGVMSRYALRQGFPLVTTKKMGLKGFVTELLWFIRGGTNIKYLHDHGCHIWDEWADANGNLGPVYGSQWRSFGGRGIDQLAVCIEGIKKDPFSRRHVVTAWNPLDLDDMALPPCHTMFQFYVSGRELSCQLYQRSCDLFLGAPFNIASYSLLTHMVAQVCGLLPGEFIHTIGDAHIYSNHFQQVTEQLTRPSYLLPELVLDKSIKTIDDFRHDHIKIVGYESHGKLEGEVAI